MIMRLLLWAIVLVSVSVLICKSGLRRCTIRKLLGKMRQQQYVCINRAGVDRVK